MHYDISLANRLRAALAGRRGVVEKEMFGGLSFYLYGRMFCGIVGDRLMVRLEPDRYEEALQEPGVSPTDLTGRSTVGHVYVAPAALSSEESIRMWVDRGVECVSRMPVMRTPPAKPARGGARKKR
ncbi:MAG: TfoX/Sxy family protein [Planctomycetota bacterium]